MTKAWSASGAVAALALVLAGGCARHAPQRAVRAAAPEGIILPAAAKPGDDVHGLYVGGSGSGVWIAPEVTLDLRKEHAASKLALVVYVPDTNDRQRAWYHAHPLSIEGRFDGGAVQRRCCFSGGVASVDFVVPPAMRSRIGAVRLHLGISGGVAEPGINSPRADRRRLALVLVRLFFY